MGTASELAEMSVAWGRLKEAPHCWKGSCRWRWRPLTGTWGRWDPGL